jgi:hypothetical protein
MPVRRVAECANAFAQNCCVDISLSETHVILHGHGVVCHQQVQCRLHGQRSSPFRVKMKRRGEWWESRYEDWKITEEKVGQQQKLAAEGKQKHKKQILNAPSVVLRYKSHTMDPVLYTVQLYLYICSYPVFSSFICLFILIFFLLLAVICLHAYSSGSFSCTSFYNLWCLLSGFHIVSSTFC